MFRFTIRDVMWLMVVVALAVTLLAASRRAAMFEARCQALERFKAGQELLEQEYLKKIYELETAAKSPTPMVRKASTDEN